MSWRRAAGDLLGFTAGHNKEVSISYGDNEHQGYRKDLRGRRQYGVQGYQQPPGHQPGDQGDDYAGGQRA